MRKKRKVNFNSAEEKRSSSAESSPPEERHASGRDSVVRENEDLEYLFKIGQRYKGFLQPLLVFDW